MYNKGSVWIPQPGAPSWAHGEGRSSRSPPQMPHGPEFKVVHGSGDSSHLLHDFVTTQCGSNIYESPFKHGNTGDRQHTHHDHTESSSASPRGRINSKGPEQKRKNM